MNMTGKDDTDLPLIPATLVVSVSVSVSVSVAVYYVAVRTIVLSRHGSNLARPVIIHDIIHGLIYVPSTIHIVEFLGSRRMETAPTSIEVLLRPTQSQSDEPSDLRGSLSPTIVYTHLTVPGGHPSIYQPGATSLNFSERADIDERTPYSVINIFLVVSEKHKLMFCYIAKVACSGWKWLLIDL